MHIQVNAQNWAGAVVLDDETQRCVSAHPRLHYCVGMTLDAMREHFRMQGWKPVVIEPYAPRRRDQ